MKQRQYLIPAAWLATAVAAFSFGRMSSWLEKPVTPPQGTSTAKDSTIVNNLLPSPVERERLGLPVSAAVEGETGTQIRTVGEVTGGQPLEDWLKKLMAQDDDLFRMQNFLKLVEALNTPEDIKTALSIIGQQRGGGRGPFGARFTEYAMLMEKFTRLNPQEAVKFATSQEREYKWMAMSSALRTWTKTQPDAALAWAQTEGTKVQMDFGRGGPGGPGGGEEGQPRGNFPLMNVITQLAKTDIDKAINTASTAEIGRMGGRMVESLVGEVIAQRGADAAKDMLGKLPDGTFKNEFIRDLAGNLARKDAPGTADWAMALPSGDAKRRALGQAIEQWAETDPTAAGSYLAKLPAGPDTDSARSEYAQQVARKDQKAAWEWAGTITDPERRLRTQEDIARTWVRADAASAQQVIANSALPDEVKARLSQPQRGGPPGGRRRN